MRIHLFAAHREQFGTTIELPVCATVAELAGALATHFPNARPPWCVCRIAVDREFGTPETPIPAGAELAVIPPVSGG